MTATRVVMCTNGFVDHVVENLAGSDIGAHMHHRVNGTVGYMAGFVENAVRPANSISYIRNEIIGESTPYVYVTRRPYDRAEGAATLTCIGGPETPTRRSCRLPSRRRFPGRGDGGDRQRDPAHRRLDQRQGAGLRLRVARDDGLHRIQGSPDRIRTAEPDPDVQPRLQRRRLPAIDLWRTSHRPTASTEMRSNRASSIRHDHLSLVRKKVVTLPRPLRSISPRSSNRNKGSSRALTVSLT